MIRCCEPTYPKEALEDIGIQVHDWTYADGDHPPGHLVSDWLRLIRQIRLEAKEKQQAGSVNTIPCIATHCVAGLGRFVSFPKKSVFGLGVYDELLLIF